MGVAVGRCGMGSGRMSRVTVWVYGRCGCGCAEGLGAAWGRDGCRGVTVWGTPYEGEWGGMVRRRVMRKCGAQAGIRKVSKWYGCRGSLDFQAWQAAANRSAVART